MSMPLEDNVFQSLSDEEMRSVEGGVLPVIPVGVALALKYGGIAAGVLGTLMLSSCSKH